MPEIHIPRLDWNLRPSQRNIWRAAIDGKNICVCAHRRYGKDEVMLNAIAVKAMQKPASYAYGFPETAHARRALWNAVNPHTGQRRIYDAFPREILACDPLENEMRIKFVTGSELTFFGLDNYDRLVGASLAGIVSSEHALGHPSAYAFFSPMLRENGGFFWAISTPRGRNHFHSLYNHASRSDAWHSEHLPVTVTGALTDVQLKEALDEYVALYGMDQGTALFNQEYLCDWNAAILGAFYAREIMQLRAEGRVADVEAVEGIPVHRAWDIGVRDDTSIWWFQVVGTQIFVLDCFSESGISDIEEFANIVYKKHEENGWEHGTDWVPHDAKQKVWGMKKGRLETMIEYGLNPQPCPNLSKLDGINAVRKTMQRSVFHPRCEEKGLAALEQYRREWDEEKKAFKQSEVHDWTSHLADAFRYLSVSWQLTKVAPKPILYPEAPSPYHVQIAPPTRKRGTGF